ncbi:hypothetical protein H6503_03525 [Candidatus Woesearchaeota archaeon]|nr:hypothetical protein [Candidatus Woesearchaeota archaeon]
MDVKQLETNLYESFTRVKSDVLHLTDELNKLANAVGKIQASQAKNSEKIEALAKRVSDASAYARAAASKKPAQVKTQRVVVEKVKQAKRAKPTYIASKNGKKFHKTNCIFTKNIKPKDIVKFKSKKAMLNKGYKPCQCVQ